MQMMLQLMSAEIDTKSWNHAKTVEAVSCRVMNPRQENMDRNKTATHGIPSRLVLLKILGARPSNAKPYNTRDPVSSPELPEDQALVSTTALIMDGTTLIPALVAAITKGDCAAVPVD